MVVQTRTDDRGLDLKVKQQLQTWKANTHKNWSDLLELSPYFFADKRAQQKLRPDTVTKTLEKRPVKDDGLYNLYTLLGILYAYEGIESLEEIKKIIDDCKISIPKDTNWVELSQKLKDGAALGRKALATPPLSIESNPDLSQVQPSDERKIGNQLFAKMFDSVFFTKNSRKAIIGVGVLLLVVVSAVISGKLLFTTQAQSGSTSICSSVQAASPNFLHDQGFSIFGTSTDTAKSGLLSSSVRSIGMNAQGVWVGYIADGHTDGINYYSNANNSQTWTQCPGLPLKQGQTINGFAFKDNSVFVAIDAANPNPNDPGVAELTQNGWKLYSRANGLPSQIVYSVQTDENGDVWATTFNGVAKLEGEYWKTVYQAVQDGLASSKVYRFLKDSKGNIWFGLLDGGISRLKPDGTWQSYYADTQGLQNVRGIVEDNEGGVWFATNGGVLRFKDEHWTQFTATQNQLLSDDVQDVKHDKFGRIWIATMSGVMYTSDLGQTWATHSTMPTLGIQFGCAGCIYNEDHLWLVLKDQGIGHVHIPP